DQDDGLRAEVAELLHRHDLCGSAGTLAALRFRLEWPVASSLQRLSARSLDSSPSGAREARGAPPEDQLLERHFSLGTLFTGGLLERLGLRGQSLSSRRQSTCRMVCTPGASAKTCELK
ncbi:unnamed protein product, partial [Polarella glacialis]